MDDFDGEPIERSPRQSATRRAVGWLLVVVFVVPVAISGYLVVLRALGL